MSQFKGKQNFQGKECFSRMNFLYQASMLMAGTNNTLSSYYGQLCKNIGKKAVLRIEPNVKRDFCKRCSLAQKPGITSDLTVKTSKRRKRNKPEQLPDDGTQIQLACKLCGHQKNFIVNSEYEFWLENPESVAEVCTIKTEQGPERSKKTSNKTNLVAKDTNKTKIEHDL